MDSFDKLSELFDGTSGEAFLRSQLAMLDLYQEWLEAGALDSDSLNDIIKSTMGAHLAMFRASGDFGHHLWEAQHELLRSYRELLEQQLRHCTREPEPPENNEPDSSGSGDTP